MPMVSLNAVMASMVACEYGRSMVVASARTTAAEIAARWCARKVWGEDRERPYRVESWVVGEKNPNPPHACVLTKCSQRAVEGGGERTRGLGNQEGHRVTTALGVGVVVVACLTDPACACDAACPGSTRCLFTGTLAGTGKTLICLKSTGYFGDPKYVMLAVHTWARRRRRRPPSR